MQQKERLINAILCLLAASLLAVCVLSIAGAATSDKKKARTEYADSH